MLNRMPRQMLRVLSCLLVMAMFGAVIAGAQTQASTGQIAGTVKDAGGAVVPNATVKVSNNETGLSQTVNTASDGYYRAVLLPSGSYTVVASAQGFSQATAKDIQVFVGRSTDMVITLAVGAVKESVTVTAEAIQVDRSEPDAVIGEKGITDLPINGRRFQDFITLTPTTFIEPSRQQISMSGQRGIYGTNVNIDGLDYNQPFFGGIRGGERANTAFTIPQESIKEFQVVPAGYTAEFGRSTGGLITAVTKSGTNAWHGSGFYFNRDASLGGTNQWYKDAGAQLTSQRGVPITVNPNVTQHQLGGSVGGPLKKDKLFLFTTYEYQHLLQPRQVLFNFNPGFVPCTAATCAAGTGGATLTAAEKTTLAANELAIYNNQYISNQLPFTALNVAHSGLARVDYQLNDHHRLNFRYAGSNSNATNSNAAGTAIFPVTQSALSNNGTEIDRNDTIAGQLASYFGATLANELRSQWTKEQRPRPANAQTPLLNFGPGNIGTVSFLGQNLEHDWRYQLADSMTWSKGKHTFKFGGEFSHVYVAQTFGFNQHGTYAATSFNNDLLLANLSPCMRTCDAADPTSRFNFASTSLQYRRQMGNLLVDYAMNQASMFVQDSWRIHPTLTLNYGLRWEGQFNPSPELGNTNLTAKVKGVAFPIGVTPDPTQIQSQPMQFGPRLGFAWDPFRNGKTVVRGFGGIYYASTPALLLAGAMNNFRLPAGDLSAIMPFSLAATNASCPTATSCNTLYKQFKLVGIDLNTFNLATPGATLPELTQAQVAQISTLMGADPLANGLSPVFNATNYKNPRSYQAGIGVERELAPGITMGVDTSWIKTVYLQLNRDLNVGVPTADPTSGRFIFPARPVPSLNTLQERASVGKSLYRSATFRTAIRKHWGQISGFYTLAENLDNDSNERNATGILYENGYNLASEYNFSNLDRRHNLQVNSLFYLPFGFEIGNTFRVRSGSPIDITAGTDVNKDGNSGSDRPMTAVGVPMKRNNGRNLWLKNVDARVAKSFKIPRWERVSFTLSADMFNLLNAQNIELQNSFSVTNFCSSSTSANVCGIPAFEVNSANPTVSATAWKPNINFLRPKVQDPTSAFFGQYNTQNENPGFPFQAQFGIRVTF